LDRRCVVLTRLWPLVNPTIVSLPLGFLGAVLGTLIWGRDAENEKAF